jgi:hypothetical protein
VPVAYTLLTPGDGPGRPEEADDDGRERFGGLSPAAQPGGGR